MPFHDFGVPKASIDSHHARARLCAYARNILDGGEANDAQRAELFRWSSAHARKLQIDLPRDLAAAWSKVRDGATFTPQARRKLRLALGAVVPLPRRHRPFGNLARMLGLDPLEEGLLTLAVDYVCVPEVEELWDRVSDAGGEQRVMTLASPVFALMLGASKQRVRHRLQAGAPLRAGGLISAPHPPQISVLPRLIPFVTDPSPPKDPRAALLGRPAEARLPFSSFAHLGETADRVRALLQGALRERAPGVHVLLYGPPGTGKTAFAAALAQAVGVPLLEVGAEDRDGDEMSRGQRLSELRLSQHLLKGGDPALLLLDEAEDLFDAGPDPFGKAQRIGSRAYVHRLIETGPLPVIWTANSIKSLGPAVLRRMSCCIEVRIPPPPVRERMWREAAAAEGVPLPSDEARALAALLPAAPALASSAMRTARLAGGDPAAVRWALSGVAQAMAGRALQPLSGAAAFDPTLVNADIDLAGLAERLADPTAPRRVSLLLCGPPGSGKSAYARHLAARMGMPVLQKRNSDLVAPFVGETEQRIAAAFAEARDAGAFLIFDEADSLLRDRVLAQRSWEVSQVNEMLTWMEDHPLPFCCTTNLDEVLDPASMRRFLVKARFDYLSPPQAARAWVSAFGHPAPPGLAVLDRLTPAEFGLVRRVAALEGSLGSPAVLLAALEREHRAKPGARSAIGFTHSG